VTVTLPKGVTTIPATTVTITPITTTQPAVPTSLVFLPTTPDSINATMAGLVDCLSCHRSTLYLEFPLPPSWDGSAAMSPNNISVYIVAPGSTQDHTDRTNDTCLTCHAVVS
jgi:hypothetical protein